MNEEKGWGKAAQWPDGIRIRYYDEDSRTYKYMRKYEEIAGYITALQNFFADKQWIDRVLVVADEPADQEKYKESLRAVLQAAPLFQFKTAINHVEFINEFKDVVSDYAPILPVLSQEWDALDAMRKEIKGRLLFYACCGPYLPNTFIASPLAESRLLPLLCSWLSLDGFLRWNYTVWPEDPRHRLAYRTGIFPSGDTNFVYPSTGGKPLLSLRYFALKRGIEDFELAAMVRKLPEGQRIMQEVWDLLIRQQDIRSWDYEPTVEASQMYSVSWRDYESAREKMLSALEKYSSER